MALCMVKVVHNYNTVQDDIFQRLVTNFFPGIILFQIVGNGFDSHNFKLYICIDIVNKFLMD